MQCDPQLYASFDGEASRYVEDSSCFLYAVYKYMRFLEDSIETKAIGLLILTFICAESRMGRKHYNLLFGSGIVVFVAKSGRCSSRYARCCVASAWWWPTSEWSIALSNTILLIYRCIKVDVPHSLLMLALRQTKIGWSTFDMTKPICMLNFIMASPMLWSMTM